MDSKQMDYGDRMAEELKVRAADTEKVTINLGLIDLGQIDLLVQEGFYSNRTDLIRTAIRNQLSTHGDVIRQTVARKSLVLGLQHYTRADLEAVQAAGQTLRIQVLGLATIAPDVTPDDEELEIIIRRELSRAGKNRIFVNNQLVTQTFLRKIGEHLVDIHGQGEQASLFSPATHLDMLDEFAGTATLREVVSEAHRHWTVSKTELGMLRQDEAEKLQLLDILKFQVNEIAAANLKAGEDDELEEERRRLRRDLHDGLGPQIQQVQRLADLAGPVGDDVDDAAHVLPLEPMEQDDFIDAV